MLDEMQTSVNVIFLVLTSKPEIYILPNTESHTDLLLYYGTLKYAVNLRSFEVATVAVAATYNIERAHICH